MAGLSSLESERGVLGIILNHNSALFDVGQILAKADFYESYNGEIYILLRDMIEAGRTVTATALLYDIQDADIGGLPASQYLRKLEEDAPPADTIIEMARRIRDAAIRRRLEALGDEIKRLAVHSPVSISAEELRTKADEAVSALFTSISDLGVRHLFKEVGETILTRLKVTGDQPIGLPVGIKQVQDLIGALLPGRLYVIGGSPGSGKSSLLLQISRYVGRQGKAALIFSPEMEGDEVAERGLAADTGIAADQIERGLINNAEYETLWDANEKAKGEGVFIDASTRPSLARMRGLCLRKQRMGGLDLMGIDYLGLAAKSSPKASEWDSFDDNLGGMKRLAKDLQLPVIVLTQYATEALRDMGRWPFREPTQGDLLFAGIVERHADAILLVHRPEYSMLRNPVPETDKNHVAYLDGLVKWRGKALALLTKRRGGLGYGRREMGFDAPRMSFSDTLPRLTDAAAFDFEGQR